MDLYELNWPSTSIWHHVLFSLLGEHLLQSKRSPLISMSGLLFAHSSRTVICSHPLEIRDDISYSFKVGQCALLVHITSDIKIEDSPISIVNTLRIAWNFYFYFEVLGENHIANWQRSCKSTRTADYDLLVRRITQFSIQQRLSRKTFLQDIRTENFDLSNLHILSSFMFFLKHWRNPKLQPDQSLKLSTAAITVLCSTVAESTNRIIFFLLITETLY